MSYLKQDDEATLKSLDVFRNIIADNDLILTRLVASSQEVVNAYIGKLYNLEPYFTGNKDSEMLKQLVLTIIIYKGYSRVMINKIPESVSLAYKDAITFLKDVAEGKLTLTLDPIIVTAGETNSYFSSGTKLNYFN